MPEDEQAPPTTDAPTLEDDKFFQKIWSDIRSRPGFYLEAGNWLDRDFGAVRYSKRDQKELQDDVRHRRSLGSRKRIAELESSFAKAVARGDERESQELNQCLAGIRRRRREMVCAVRDHRERKGQEAPLAKLEGIMDAVKRYREEPPVSLTLQEAKRVLLITWLMTDPTVDKAPLGLTAFENWRWDTGDGYDESDRRGRRYAGAWLLRSAGKHPGWRELARRSWELIQAESPSPTPTPTLSTGKARREPSPMALEAYRVHILCNTSQTEVAEMLSAEAGRKIHQGQVSKWIDQVSKYLKAGNVLPELPTSATKATVRYEKPGKLDYQDNPDGRPRPHKSPLQYDGNDD